MRNTNLLEKRVFSYLNKLRESGKTNMYGACPYLIKKFKLESSVAKNLLVLWIKNFRADGNYDKIKEKE